MTYADVNGQGTVVDNKWAPFQVCNFLSISSSPIQPVFVLLWQVVIFHPGEVVHLTLDIQPI